MCAIAGIFGEDISKDLKDILISLKHRGPDGSGLFIDGEVLHGEIKQMDFPEGSVGLGHNLLSIVGCQSSQPIIEDNQVLVCNGEIYNFREIKEELNEEFTTDSDCEVILKLNNSFEGENLLSSIRKTMQKLDGDYAFALWDGQNLVLGRDPVGVKPLYYGEIKGKIKAFASEKKALWKIGIMEVHTLPPGHIRLNDQLISVEELPLNGSPPYQKDPESKTFNLQQIDAELLKRDLKHALIRSVEKRITGLENVGLIFSGGVDSTILACILKNLPVKTTLYTVGSENSQDLGYALKAAEILNLDIRTQIVTEDVVKYNLEPVLSAIEEFNVMKIGVGMPTYLAAKMAKEDHQKVVLTGQGADELFAGYNRYLMDYSQKGEDTQDVLKKDIANIYHVNLQRDDAVTMAHGVELRVPFLDREVIKAAFNIPFKYKILDENDKIRKHMLRQVAVDLGVPEFIAQRPKKAAQYGSGINKILIKKVLKDFNQESYMKKLRGF
ncbi:asparagine synthase (glutamine-hydrolyzing) [Methanobacterium alcaliphilum]|uniref:asparagine synthase (glutamine-hydrolyzing) n=1 Tax=Methanobacterium alcaliphilum TaxID=392018 RepID=UPI00200B5AE6|nr:asparagine synthase (glutamine-hydrolyzing) [Methanobacterium alcaliphilum]MCK9150666.1 asparagine synthase (glutamine-hydrolyzing) [Methanobacterium alcaliphilum]